MYFGVKNSSAVCMPLFIWASCWKYNFNVPRARQSAGLIQRRTKNALQKSVNKNSVSYRTDIKRFYIQTKGRDLQSMKPF